MNRKASTASPSSEPESVGLSKGAVTVIAEYPQELATYQFAVIAICRRVQNDSRKTG
jgi:hypothetical protein